MSPFASKRAPIFVVIDDAARRSAMERALVRAGYSEVLAADVGTALECLGRMSAAPGGIMLDTGIQSGALQRLILAIATTPRLAGVPVLLIRQDEGSASRFH